jgi:trans-aconitate methyltransferase
MDSQGRVVTYPSPPMPVNMGDWWFDVATNDHFWIRRRFEVMQRLADAVIRNCTRAAEIGCGNGLLQRDIEDRYGKPVTGFELNEVALHKNLSCMSPLYCYDIHQRNPEFRAHFDLLPLFDVLEHIDDESGFLQSVKFHLADSGSILINVPAHQSLYSDYDRAAGACSPLFDESVGECCRTEWSQGSGSYLLGTSSHSAPIAAEDDEPRTKQWESRLR